MSQHATEGPRTKRGKATLIPRLLVLSGLAVILTSLTSLSATSFSVPALQSTSQRLTVQSSASTLRGAISYEHHVQSQVGVRSELPKPASFVAGAHEEDVGAPAHLVLAATALAAVAGRAGGGDPARKSKSLVDYLKLPLFVGLWYFFNVQYNLKNKMLLKYFSATWAVSWFQMLAGIPIALAMWSTGFVKRPKVTGSDLVKLAPVGLAFSLGQVCTVASLGAVAVSFTHVVKALEPAVNAVASAVLLGQVFHPVVYLSLAPVFLGVTLASSSELSFTMFGFLTAMMSNFAFATRNVLATKLGSVGDLGEDQTERKTNQLAILTMVAAAVLFPVALFVPGGLQSVPAAWQAALAKGVPAGELLYLLLISSFHFFMYQLSSFWVLSQVPPITHSVLNTLKRCVIIVVSIIVFRTPVTTRSAFGTGMAVGGVLLYSLTKQFFSKKS